MSERYAEGHVPIDTQEHISRYALAKETIDDIRKVQARALLGPENVCMTTKTMEMEQLINVASRSV